MSSNSTQLKQYPIDSSDHSLSAQVERTLNTYRSPPTNKKHQTSDTTPGGDGLFDRFIKNYSSTTAQSVQDEPELSFVSYKTVSNPVSPTKKSTYNNNNSSSENASAYTTSKLSNASSNDSSLSLIHLQQKQLMKQFANLSPIDLNQNSLTNKKMMKSMSTVDFTLFETKADYSDENDDQEEEGYDDENSHDMTSSLVLFSPEKEKEE